VDGVGEQCHRPGDGDDDELDQRGCTEHGEADDQGSHAFAVRGGGVDGGGVVVAVGGDQVANGSERGPVMRMVVALNHAVLMRVVVVVVVVQAHERARRGRCSAWRSASATSASMWWSWAA
jgi:hypothetical protein